jgi:LPXTG-motif cell wall anchor domain protein
MAYKLAEEDKLCGIEYPTYEGFKPIPKATCDMLKPQCNDIEIVLNCDKKKEEEKPTPTPTPQPEPTPEPQPQPEPSPTPNPEEPQPTPQPQPEEPKPQPNPVEPTPEHDPAPKPVLTNEELDTIVSGKLSTNTTLGNYYVNQNNTITLIGDAPLEDIEAYKKEITDKVGDIPELKDYTVEVLVNKIPGDNVGDKATGAPLYTKVVKITKPNGEVYQSEPMSIGTTTETNIDLLEALPRVEDKFSKIIAKDGQVVEVPEVSNDDKRAFEDKIINDLKAKLPEGTTVEAVLEGPKYEKGSEVLSGKTNYVLNVRTTLNGVVSEQTYNVPHTEEAPQEEPAVPEADIDGELLKTNLGVVNIDGDTILSINIPDKVGGGQGEPITESNLPSISEGYRASLEEILNRENNTSKKYKVNSYNITMLKHVGDHSYYDDPIFTYTVTITKPNGEVVTKEGKLHSTFVETL